MQALLRKIVYFVGLSLICAKSLYAQFEADLIPPSANASSLTKVASTPVNLFNGKLDVSIPIYSVKGRSISCDISLQYSGSSGIKVQDIAGPAGLGWTLDVGGVITRTVRGEPDDLAGKGYCMNGNTGLSTDHTSSGFESALKTAITDWDMEPDIFVSSIGGRIVFNAVKAPQFMSEQGYLIKRNGIFSADSTWEIVDPKGNSYLFGANSIEREHSITTPSQRSYISSWYLSEVRSPDGEVIRFTYEKGQQISYAYYSKSKAVSVSGSQTNVETKEDSTRITTVDPVFLKSISAPNATISFTYNERWDILGQRAFEKITVTQSNGTVYADFRFKNGYFGDGTNPFSRHKLLGIEQYNNDRDRSISLAEFQYYEDEVLPSRNSAEFDHWGYYNHNPSGKRLKSEGASKASNLARNRAGVLSVIKWPTGGQTQFEYELNTFRRNGVIYSGGGLRVRLVKQVERGNVSETGYVYIGNDNLTSGQLQHDFNPDSGYIAYTTSTVSVTRTDQPVSGPGGGHPIEIVNGEATVEHDLPLYQLLDLNGNAIGYSEVTIINPDQSKEKQLFNNFSAFPEKPVAVFLVDPFIVTTVTSFSPNRYGFFGLYSPNHLQRGTLREKQLINSSGSILKQINYKYELVKVPGASQIAGVVKKPHFFFSDQAFEAVKYVAVLYHEVPSVRQIVTEETITCASDLSGSSGKEYVRNDYKQNYPFLVEKSTMWRSNGDSTIAVFKYPIDFLLPLTGIADQMIQRNILVPLEIVQKNKSANGEFVTGATINSYGQTGSWVLPTIVKTLNIKDPVSDYVGLNAIMATDSRIAPKVFYDLYASSGELLQYHQANDLPCALFWGYNRSRIIAKVTGASFNTAVQFVDTALLNSGTLTDSQMRVELSKLRTNLPGTFVTTYTHQPLVGITSETDPAGQIKFYEYDDFQRLKLIKDNTENIINQFEYFTSSAGGWKDTQVKRCLRDGNNMFTGEEEVQQTDTDPSSATFGQTRWRSLGQTNSCNRPIYAKLFYENVRYSSSMGAEGFLIDIKIATLVVRFFEDPACTIPQYVRPIDVSYRVVVRPGGFGVPYYTSQTGGTMRAGGTSFVLKQEVVLEEVNYPGWNPLWYAYDFYLSLGREYVVVP
ncbi:SpvB/TcaC N-terminal domain-containing protein [Chitinophaga sp.]|uniref:SpvB/TcaC N-terminal domain-containing protein n=1 Tax=Chitinophaga sp. TaxID=1869181 RepID=UPI0031E455B6